MLIGKRPMQAQQRGILIQTMLMALVLIAVAGLLGFVATGRWLFWYPDGQLQAKASYREGALVAADALEATRTRIGRTSMQPNSQ